MKSMKSKIFASGIALLITGLLLFQPEAKAQVETGENIMTSAAQFGQIQYFRTLIEEVGLDDKLNEDGPFTVFAPTDEAFNEIPEAELQELLESPDDLREVLLAHIAEGAYQAEHMADRDDLTMVNGVEINVDQHERGISVGDALMVAADIVATNGVIHAVDKVILPE